MNELDPDLLFALRRVFDPELGLNVVDLGLVYEARREGDVAHVAITTTTPACPLHETLTENARAAIEAAVPGIREVRVVRAFEPPWTPERMSDEAKQQLGWQKGTDR
ncbi:MAG: metal-sulfur cluster assembly factor [Myxococcaceae bacterium]|nr:metal-sulfur cluster assembly factor [Myxococcaceae bacterium]